MRAAARGPHRQSCARRAHGHVASGVGTEWVRRRQLGPLLVPDDIASAPVSLQTLKPAADRANPRIGVGTLAFSPDNYFLATRNGQCGSPAVSTVPSGAGTH